MRTSNQTMKQKWRVWILLLAFSLLILRSPVSGQVSPECASLEQVFPNCSCSSLQQRVSVDCSGRGLTTVPTPGQSYTSTIDELKLNNNSISSLEDNILPGLTILSLDLGENPIRTVSINTFSSLGTQLTRLVLSGDSTREPPADSFRYLGQLDELVLQNYYVVNLNDSHPYFSTLVKLKKLTLDRWQLLAIDAGSFYPTRLQSLAILNQPMVNIPLNELQEPYMSGLQKLKISGTHINRVTPFVFDPLSSLHELDLNSNFIDTLEDNCFGSSSKTLIKLSLANNILTEDSTKLIGLKNLQNLEELDLSGNQFRNIPVLSQVKTSKLLFLNLRSNLISSLNAEIQDNSMKLKKLDLSQNDISSIDAMAFEGMTSLQVLNMTQRPRISPTTIELPSSLTQASGSLIELYLDRLNVNPSSLWAVIERLNMIQVLSLVSMRLTNIPKYALINLSKLTKIDVSSNNITEITQETLLGPRTTLKELYLASNGITTLPLCMFFEYTSFPLTMRLNNNQLVCNCSVSWLWSRIKNATVTFNSAQDPTCSGDGIPFSNKTLESFCNSQLPDSACPSYYTTLLNMSLSQTSTTSVTVSWQVSRSIDVVNFTLDVSNVLSQQPIKLVTVPATVSSFTFNDLPSNVDNEFCVRAILKSSSPVVKCDSTRVIIGTTQKPETPNGLSNQEIGIIVGVIVGAVVLFALLAAIGYLLICRRKAQKQPQDIVPAQPRNFSKSELPAMNEESRTFRKPKKPAEAGVGGHREGMQVVAISDGQTDQPRVGRALILNSNGSYNSGQGSKPVSVSSQGSKPVSVSSQSSYQGLDKDRGPLPPPPASHVTAHPNGGYYNQGYKDDSYDEISHGKESTF